MTQWYNLSSIQAQNPLIFIQTTNHYFMSDMLGTLILIMIFAISIISFNQYNQNPKINYMFSSFITMFVAIGFRLFQTYPLVNDLVVYITIIMFASSLLFIKLFEEN